MTNQMQNNVDHLCILPITKKQTNKSILYPVYILLAYFAVWK